jgi:putative two-component system response regulator
MHTLPGRAPTPPRRILVADDEAVNLKVLAAFLRDMGHVAVLADCGAAVLQKLKPDIDLVLLDVLMPGIDGFETVRRIRRDPAYRDLPVIMVTALTGKEDRLAAVAAGANDFIAKPLDRTELKVRMDSLLRMKASQDEVKRYQASLEEMVDQRTEALRLALDNLRRMQLSIEASQRETIMRLSAAAEYKDDNTASHIKRMSAYSALLARLLGLPAHDVDVIRQASPMHDVGKMGIPDSILLKPGKLDPDEWEFMKTHTAIGRSILAGSDSELLQVAEQIAYSHHERYDGTGYPEGLAGEDIPLFGRICAVADVFDALTTARPYKEPYSNEKALAIMRAEQEKGPHFDPRIFSLFLDNLDEFLNIQSKCHD